MLVFRKDLYFKDESVAKQSDVWKDLCNKWAEECDGRTKEELVSEGHIVMDNWCEDVAPVHNPWRTFNELPPIELQILIKDNINGFPQYSVAEFNDDMLNFSDDNWRIEDAINGELKWKYIEDEEE